MRHLATALAGLLALSVGSYGLPAHAQQNCAPLDAVVENLTARYGETIQASGISTSGIYVMWWGNIETGSWTVTATAPDGTTCLVAHGGAFDASRQAPAPMGEPG
jgi:hypothetical protein